MKHRTHLIIFFLSIGIFASAIAQEKTKQQSWSLSTVLPVNPKVKIGKLANGLTYYIMKNKKPENRLELRLAVNAGSVLENDDQQGLAHFCEHMAFNGTKNFKKDQLVKYLESIGTRFGNDLNAYTSFDETVYMLQIPTDKEDILNQGFQVLEDWAHNVSYDNDEIDKERGVIIEELRLGKGAGMRIRDKQFPIIFKNSKYAERLPIGKEEILKNFKYETLKKFYKEWYRPDLMAVIAIGDIDEGAIEKKIIEHFSKIEKPATPLQRPVAAVPDHKESLYTIVTDPEATGSSLNVYFKHDPQPQKKVIDYRRSIGENIYNTMLSERFDELRQQANPPFLYAYSNYGRFVRAKDVYTLGAQVESNGITKGLDAVLTEALRVKKHGFTETELERAKTNVLRQTEEMFNERDKTNSANFVNECVSHFLREEPMPGIEIEYDLQKKYVPSITLDDVNKLGSTWISDKNMVVTASLPEKKDITPPTEKELKEVFESVSKKEIEAYVDKQSLKPLAEVPPTNVRVTSEKKDADLGTTEWVLSNGIHVILKPTIFKNDDIEFYAISPGGSSLVDAKDYTSATMAARILDESGLGEFDAIQLRKALTGKVVDVSPYISDLYEGLSGRTTPKDLETMFQLVYLYFASPRKDTTAYASFMRRMKSMLENYGARPEAVYSDSVSTIMSSYHPLRKPMNVKRLEEIDLETAFKVYKDRFADAGDFTFVFVGSFTPEQLKPLVEKYIGALPIIKRTETWRDIGVHSPDYKIEKTVVKGIEQKSTVTILFTGPFDWAQANRYNYSALGEVLKIKLREAVREEKGGTYGVNAMTGASKYPRSEYRLIIQFGCNPTRVDELVNTVFDVLKNIIANGASDEDVKKVQEIQRREREKSLKENSFWLQRLQQSLQYNDDPREILKYNEFVDGLNSEAIRNTAKQYITLDNYKKFVLVPEEKK